MEENNIFITEEGLNELKREYEELVHVTREEVKEDLRAARAQGDLSENADYDAAKNRQAQVEARISELDYQIKNAQIISDKRKDSVVMIGSMVELKELDTNDVHTYRIVGSIEADPLNGLLSNMTPLAEAIMDHKVNDVCEVKVDSPYQVKILKIN